MLGQLQALALVVGLEVRAIELIGQGGHAFIDQPAHDLPVFQHEGRLVAAHLQHPAARRHAAWPKPGSKKPA
jgi:hypothetical protein